MFAGPEAETPRRLSSVEDLIHDVNGIVTQRLGSI